MDAEIAASLKALEAELVRLDALAAGLSAEQRAPISNARASLAQTIATLSSAVVTTRIEASPAPSRIADRIVVIAPPGSAETFRTKVKLKTPEVPVAVEPAPPEPPSTDDLTRIRGIDRVLAGRLTEHGITSFAAIAAWAQPDVRRLSQALDLGRQISRQNWIEQAALLTAATSKSAPQVPAAAIVSTPAVSLVAQEFPAEVVPPAAPPVLAPAPVADHPPDVVTLPPDRLDLIAGIDAAMAARLGALGITRWAEIAAWTRADMAKTGVASIARQGWIEQAALLAFGRLSQYASRSLRGDFAALVPAPSVEPLPPVVRKSWDAPTTAVTADPETVPEPIAPLTIAPMPSIIVADVEPVFDIDAALVLAAEMPASPSEPAASEPAEQLPTTPAVAAPAAIDTSLAAALNRVAVLEQELAAQVANDKTVVTATAPAALPALRPSSLHVEDEEFPELHVAEADVKIVRRVPESAATASTPTDPITSRGMRARLRRSSALDDIDKASYAGYRDHVEEASVEIVKSGTRPALPEPRRERPPMPGQSPLKRLLHPFKRQT